MINYVDSLHSESILSYKLTIIELEYFTYPLWNWRGTATSAFPDFFFCFCYVSFYLKRLGLIRSIKESTVLFQNNRKNINKKKISERLLRKTDVLPNRYIFVVFKI